MELISSMYFCSLFKQLKRMTWNLKNLLATVLKSRILLECTLVSELKDTFLQQEGKSAGQPSFIVFLVIPWRSKQQTQIFVHLKCMSPFSCPGSSLPFNKALSAFVFSLTVLIGIRKKREKRTSSFLLPRS